MSSSKKKSFSFEPRRVSGYFSSVLRHVSKRWPLTLMRTFSSVVQSAVFLRGVRGHGVEGERGTHPMAAARAKGSQAVTEAIVTRVLCGQDQEEGQSQG